MTGAGRSVRLIVALTVAGMLAVFVLYTSLAGGATLSLSVSFPNPANRRPCTQVTQLRLRLARAGDTWHIVSLDQTGTTSSPGCNG